MLRWVAPPFVYNALVAVANRVVYKIMINSQFQHLEPDSNFRSYLRGTPKVIASSTFKKDTYSNIVKEVES